MNATAPVGTIVPSLTPGDLCPWIRQRTSARAEFAVDSMAGRYLVFAFVGTVGDELGRAAIDAVIRHRAAFDDTKASFFGVSVDPGDEAQGRVRDTAPGIRFLWDFDGKVSKQCGAIAGEAADAANGVPYRRFWMIVDPTLHVLAIHPLVGEEGGFGAVLAQLATLPDPTRYGGFEIPAPILLLPNVLEPEFCSKLIGLYEAAGGEETGVMRAGGGVLDHSFKRRKDYTVEDVALKQAIDRRIQRRVVPEIRKLFFMNITRMERYIVGCYAAEDGGHFRPHRDNGPGPTEHRRFAVSINLNDDFEGGRVGFPEYNANGYKAPAGWAVVFPCAILHAVSAVTRGRRYAFLPFVYDDAGAKLRAQRLKEQAESAAA